MRLFSAVFFIVAMLSTAAHGASLPTAVERQDWQTFFEQHNAVGTLVVLDQRSSDAVFQVYNPSRASKPYLPASTYKIPHALFALEHGVVKDEFQVFKWDGVKRDFDVWNSDHDLRSSMRGSVVWVYQWIGLQIGQQAAKTYLEKAGYGNADPSGGKEGYWLDGNIRINAYEQIQFLQKLYANSLPFKLEHQRLVKDIIIVEAGRDWILRAKTGWEGSFGWWVGYVELPTGPVFFALNIDTPNRLEDLPKRQAITRAVLKSMDVLPQR